MAAFYVIQAKTWFVGTVLCSETTLLDPQCESVAWSGGEVSVDQIDL